MLIGRLISEKVSIKIGYLQIPTPKLRLLVISHGGWLGEIDEIRAAMFVDFLKRSLKDGEADAAILHYSQLSSPLARQALTLPHFFCRDHLIMREQHPKLNLPIGDKTFLASLSQNERYQQRKRVRKLAQDFAEVRIDTFFSPQSVSMLMQNAETIAQKSYQRGIGVGFDASDFMRTRLEFLARIGWLRGFVLFLDGRPSAFWIGTLRNGIFVSDYLAFDSDFRKYVPGMYLIIEVINILASDGIDPARQIDFGPGYVAYKERLSNQTLEEALVHIFAPSFRGLAINSLRSTAGSINYTLKTLFGDSAWLAAAKKKWHALSMGAEKVGSPPS